MKKLINKVSILVIILSSFYATKNLGQTNLKFIRTNQVQSLEDAQDNKVKRNRAKIEKFISKTAKRGVKVKDVIIPVVFHVLYSKNEERISEALLLSQIDALNRDFSSRPQITDHPAMRKANFISHVASMEIKFCLAYKKVQGKEVSAINYLNSAKTKWDYNLDEIRSQNNGAESWDTKKFLNIWIADLEDKTSGYAQFPGGEKEIDGIVIDYKFVGIQENSNSIFNQGKTLTHLVGNFLGLKSLWGSHLCEDDGVSDTPIHNAPNYYCTEYSHISTCQHNTEEMTMNFMDAGPDECLTIFTIGQKLRLHAFLSPGGPRHSLTTGKSQCDQQGNNALAFDDILEIDLPGFESSEIRVYPNPANHEVYIEYDFGISEQVQVEIIHINGISTQISSYLSGVGRKNLITENLSAGVYLIQFRISDTIIQTEKLFIVK